MNVAREELASRVADIVRAENTGTDSSRLARFTVDGIQPALLARPGSVEELRKLVRLAGSEGFAIVCAGAGSKLDFGMPPRKYSLALDMTRLSRVIAHDPGDLTLTVEAGCRLRDLQAVLAEHGQFLPYEPAFANEATIGGCLAANASSLCREGYGMPRDFTLGMEFVTGEGEIGHSGGRVVKNVTGYDLHKLLIGSLGTLAIVIRINLRSFPLLREGRLFIVRFSNSRDAFKMLRSVRAAHLKPQTLLILGGDAGALLEPSAATARSDSSLLVAIARGHVSVLRRHEQDFAEFAEKACADRFAQLDTEAMQPTADHLRELFSPLRAQSGGHILARLSVLPSEAPALLTELQERARKEDLRCAWALQAAGPCQVAFWKGAAGSVENAFPQIARFLFESAEKHGARAVIESCPTQLKSECNVWGPLRKDFELMRRIKETFDSKKILSPGRFAGGL